MIGKTAKTVLCGGGILVFLVTGAMAAGDGALTMDPARVQQLQDRMTNDPGMMELIMSLQNDPDMQVLLSDPAIADKIRAGDLDALANDSRLIKLLDKKQVKDLGKRLQ